MGQFKFTKSFFSLIILFVVSAAAIFFMMGLTYKHLEKLSEHNRWMNHSLEVSLKLEKLYTSLKDIEAERRNYILTQDPQSKILIEKDKRYVWENMIELKIALKDNHQQTKKLITLQKLIDEKIGIVEGTFSEKKISTNNQSIKESLLVGRNVMQNIGIIIEEMLITESELHKKRKDDFFFAEKSTPLYIYVFSLFSLALLGYAFFRIYDEVGKQKKINDELQLALNTSHIAENIGEYGVWIYNYKTKEYIFSDNHFRILGYEPNSVKPNKGFFLQHAHSEDVLNVEKQFDKKNTQDFISPFSFRMFRKDGVERIFQITAKKIGIESGEPVLLGITSDITEEMKNKENLQQAYKEILFYNESTKEAEKIGSFGFCRWNLNKNKFFYSDNVYIIFGYEPNAFPPDVAPFLEIVHPEDMEMVTEKVQQMREGDNILTFTHRIFRKNDGALRNIRISNKYIKDEANGNYLLSIIQDVTNEILVNQKMQENNRNLEATNKELQSFNYIASHDLQEPLRKIETFISRIDEKEADKFSETGKQYFERMKFASQRMRKLIDDLLQFSRTSRNESHSEKTNLNALMENAIEELQQKIEEKKAKIIYDKLPELMVVPFQIQQLFSNLIGNSLKYSKEDIPPKIEISVALVVAKNEEYLSDKSVSGKYYKFIFKDNGIGFEPEFQEKVFDLFTRLHGKTEYEGTGIGLAICKKIVENHNGFIFAKSALSEGSTFTILLPSKI